MDQPQFSGEAGPAYRYAVFGLSIASPFPLPELIEAPAVGAADVEIALGEPAAASEEGREGFFSTASGGLLDVNKVARYRIDDGRRITVEPYPTGSERHIRLYLLGSALGALLHQRRLLPLHANAMDFGGRAVAFMGASGAGKSTMAAWFHDRGSSGSGRRRLRGDAGGGRRTDGAPRHTAAALVARRAGGERPLGGCARTCLRRCRQI
jgi:hypothetical protein